jgi:hypothetical protein
MRNRVLGLLFAVLALPGAAIASTADTPFGRITWNGSSCDAAVLAYQNQFYLLSGVAGYVWSTATPCPLVIGAGTIKFVAPDHTTDTRYFNVTSLDPDGLFDRMSIQDILVAIGMTLCLGLGLVVGLLT